MSKIRNKADSHSIHELKRLGEIARSISNASVDLELTLQTILDESLKLIDARHGNLMLVEEEELIIKTTTTPVKDQESGLRVDISNSVCGLAFIRKEAVLIPDVEQELLYQRILQDEHMRSELAVPLISDSHVIGVLNIESPNLNAFTDYDKELLQTLANLAALAIQNSRVNDLAILSEIDRNILSSSFSLDQTLQTILDESLRLIKAQHGHLTLLEGQELVIKATSSQSKDRELGQKLDINNSVSGKSLSQMDAVLIPNVDKEPLYQRILSDEYMRSELVVPLIEDGRAIGVINIESSEINAFTEKDKELLKALAGRAAAAVNNARSTDELKILREIDKKILSSTVNLEQTLETILTESLRLIDAKYGLLLLVKGEELIVKATTSHIKNKDLGTRLQKDNSISGRAVIQKCPILVENVEQDPSYQRVLQDEYMRSNLAVPLINDDHVIGVINIESTKLNAFTERDIKLIQAMANQAVIAIREAQSNQILKELRAIDSDILSSGINLNRARRTIQSILERTLRLIDADSCDISIVEGSELLIKASTLHTFLGDKLDIDNSISGLAVKQSKPVYIPFDVSKDPLYKRAPADQVMQSEYVVPVAINGTVFAVFNVESVRPDAFTDNDKEIVQALAGQAAIALKNSQSAEELKQTELIKASGDTAMWLTHKIGNLALGIGWPVERLREETDPLNISALEDLMMIKEAARQIVGLKNDLMAPFQVSKTESISIIDIFNEAIEFTQIPKIIISQTVLGNLPSFQASRRDMLDVFAELLNNAMNAMEEVEEKRIEFSAYRSHEEAQNFIVVKLSDNGYGISPEKIDQIWALGFTTKRDQGGTGFGMYKCAQLLHKIDARIFVESEIEQGTIFTLHFPIDEKI